MVLFVHLIRVTPLKKTILRDWGADCYWIYTCAHVLFIPTALFYLAYILLYGHSLLSALMVSLLTHQASAVKEVFVSQWE